MAVYKVPQDVEADDKLLGPFSFKQFIFLIVAVMALGIAWGLSQIVLPLALIPLPIAIFFIILALPLRKDQPMEVYVAAVISFMLRPKVRLWKPDGIETLIEVIAPKSEDRQYGKGYSQEEVQRRLSYLANLVDSRGWSVRGVTDPDSSLRSEFYHEAQAMSDLLDEEGSRAQQIDSLLARNDAERRQQLMNQMHQPQPLASAQPAKPDTATPQLNYNPAPVSPLYTPMSAVPPASPDQDIKLVVNPYPTMNQSVITPLSEQKMSPPPVATPKPEPAPTTSSTAVSPAIIDLANNHSDLSVETLQREAKRLKEKEQQSQEVVISLR
ncbi:hypothetical protein B7Y94_04585 [Candidatus Saccharibacteria bacterium 32-49-12]|nr:MAG: hypothetical protein B7Y94_04585 [Candidatus Saccharibacteria bacterium 32-49-12]